MTVLGVMVLAEGEPSPSPTAPDTVPIELWEASPGIYGFLFFFAMALALMVLGRSMLRHSRKVDQNAQVRAEGEKRVADSPEETDSEGEAGSSGRAGS